MKPIIAFIAAFVVATAAASGAKLATHKPVIKKDSTMVDSAKRDSLRTDSVAKSDSAVKAPTITVTPQGTPAVPAPGHSPVADTTEEPKRLAKLFGSMEAKDAEKVLAQMSDHDVHVILFYVGTKQAAAILSEFPADRAATISKMAIKGSGK